MRHYYTDNSDLESHRTTFIYHYHDYDINFTSDAGVFSKTMVDYGSRVLLENIIIDNTKTKILDVGCGYGTFGISLKKVYPHCVVDMVDVNDRALELCRINAANNNIETNIYKSNIYDEVKDSYDLIISNPPIRAGKEVVHKILTDAYCHLEENGELWIVIQKKQGAPSAKNRMFEVFKNVEVVKKDKGYYILMSRKHRKGK